MTNHIKHTLIAFFLLTGIAFAANPSITSPVQNGNYSGSSLNLAWQSNGSAVTYYYLYVGTYRGGNNILSRMYGNTTLNASVPIPSHVNKAYVRFWYKISGSWRSTSYTFNRGAVGVPARTTVCCMHGLPVPQSTRDNLASAGALGNGQYRWENTATNSNVQRGDPITLTWSIVPDGSIMTGLYGEPNTPSNFKARLNQIFGNEATWRGHMQDVFDDWGRKTGITFVYSAQDDGQPYLNNLNHIINPGVLGVRGDIRIGGHPIDGNSRVLAYALYPEAGDIIFDTNDNTYDAPGVDREAIFKAVLAHEIGHTLGLGHVCPNNQTKLMETLASDTITGPMHDEIVVAQRLYGDTLNNNTSSTAKNLGTAHQNILTIDTVGIDGSNDIDYFKFTISEADSKTRITLSPFGDIFEVGTVDDRTGGCLNQRTHNTKIRNKLSIQLLGSNGSTVIKSESSQPIGQDEVIIHTFAQTGTYYLKVTGNSDASQPYILNLETESSVPPYHNQNNKYDVNGDNEVTATDALAIINQIARQGGSGPLPTPEGAVTKFYDVNADNNITSIDALIIINRLGRLMGL